MATRRRREPRQRVAKAHQQAAFLDGDHLRDQEVEDHALHAQEDAEEPQEEARADERPGRRQQQPAEGEAQDLHPHQRADREPHRQHAAPVFDHRRPHHRREEHAEVLEPARDADRQVRARQRGHVRGKEGRRVDQPHAGLAQQPVAQVREVVAAQVAAHLRLEGFLPRRASRCRQRRLPPTAARVAQHAAGDPREIDRAGDAQAVLRPEPFGRGAQGQVGGGKHAHREPRGAGPHGGGQLGGRERTRGLGARRAHLVRERQQRLEDRGGVLARRDREHEMRAPARQPREHPRQRPRRGGGMSRVDQHDGCAAQQLDPPRKLDAREPSSRRLGKRRVRDPAGAPHAGEGQGRVARLMGAEQRKPHLQLHRAVGEAHPKPLGPLLEHLPAKVPSLPRQRHAELPSARRHHLAGLAGEIPGHRRDAGLEDPRLLGGDLAQRVAQLVRVLELDAGDAGDLGPHDVGRIEAAPEPDLEDHALDPGLPEAHQGRRRRRVEEGGRLPRLRLPQRLDVRTHALDGRRELRLLDLPPVQPDALGPALEVRRRERADPLPRGEQHGLGEQRRGALALGAGHVNHAQALVGSLEPLEQPPDRLEPEPCVGPVGALLEVDQPLQPGAGILDAADHALPRAPKERGGPTAASREWMDPSGRVTAPCSASTGGTPSPPRSSNPSPGSRTSRRGRTRRRSCNRT